MCIRDRLSNQYHPYLLFAFAGGSTTGAPELTRGKSALAGNCLLYTSDAADERSSVDLGGRRIIKKKK